MEPEGACISTSFVTGCEQAACYTYSTRAEDIAYRRKLYEELLKSSKPLFTMSSPGIGSPMSALRGGKTIHRIADTLSLASMPRSLLGRMFDRAGLSEEARREISSDWFDASELLADKLRSGETVHECVWLPGREALDAGAAFVDTTHARLCYTPEEYAGHFRYILNLMKQHPTYRFHPLADVPLRQMRLTVTEQLSVFSSFAEHPLDFSTSHPTICHTLVNFALRLEEQYDMDQRTLKETLKRYT